MASRSLSLRLGEETIDQLNQIAQATDRDVSYLMRRAIETFTEHEGWIIEETRKRWDDVQEGRAQLVPHEEVARRLRSGRKPS